MSAVERLAALLEQAEAEGVSVELALMPKRPLAEWLVARGVGLAEASETVEARVRAAIATVDALEHDLQ